MLCDIHTGVSWFSYERGCFVCEPSIAPDRESFEPGRGVSFIPCPSFRTPLEGDLLTCASCGWFIEEHDTEVQP